MEREVVTMDEYGRVVVPFDTTNIWMSEIELMELFGTTAPTLRSAIRAVYKSGVLKQHEAERYIHLPDGYGMDVYALSMVVALVFRIDTPCAARVRDALLERFYGRKEKQVLWVSTGRPMCEC
jgi:putative lipoprotein